MSKDIEDSQRGPVLRRIRYGGAMCMEEQYEYILQDPSSRRDLESSEIVTRVVQAVTVSSMDMYIGYGILM